MSTRDRGTGPVTDEELLIKLARQERRATRSRRGAATMLAVAVPLAVIAVPVSAAAAAEESLGLLVVAAQAGASALALVIAAVAAVVPSRAAKARRAEIAPAPALGPCPACGTSTLREYPIRYVNGAATGCCGGRGVATLCAAPGCDYAAARVASRRTLRSLVVVRAWADGGIRGTGGVGGRRPGSGGAVRRRGRGAGRGRVRAAG